MVYLVPPRASASVAPLAGSVDRNSQFEVARCNQKGSLPSRGAWIEMVYLVPPRASASRSLPSRGAWIEIYQGRKHQRQQPSLPSRGAWIEIVEHNLWCETHLVAPLAGSVDRNKQQGLTLSLQPAVAPLAGSVDRNSRISLSIMLMQAVAPLAGSVDRNLFVARVVWHGRRVAPLAGSVDRNQLAGFFQIGRCRSLPSRGAWIEMSSSSQISAPRRSRSPRGERG